MRKMSESIIEELLAENERLRNMSGETIGEEEVHTLSDFTYEDLADKMKISGILISPGLWNGVYYGADELKKMYDKYQNFLSGRMIYKVEHEKDQEFGRDEVGKMDQVKWDDSLKSIVYEATIDDERAMEDIKSGRFRATSLKSKMTKVKQGGVEKGIDIQPLDNSLTESPACAPCRITYYQELSKNAKGLIFYGIFDEEYIRETLLKREETGDNESKMSEVTELSVLVLPEEEELSEDELELELMPVNQALLEKRIIYKFISPGTLEDDARKVKRKKYPYYYDEDEEDKKYPYYYYPYDKRGKGKGSLADPNDMDEWEELQKYIIRKNKKTGKFVVFERTGKTGFGAFKIVKQFDTEKEAKDFISGKGEKSEEEKSEYTNFIKTCMEGGKTMEQCAAEWKAKGKGKETEEKQSKLKVEKTGENEWTVMDYSGDQPKKLKSFPTPEAAEEYKEDLLKKGITDKKLSQGEGNGEELRRKRCEFCDELVEDLDSHYNDCSVHKETVENVLKCKFCGEEFPNMDALKKHLPGCEKYKEKYPKAQKLSAEGEGDPDKEGQSGEGGEGEPGKEGDSGEKDGEGDPEQKGEEGEKAGTEGDKGGDKEGEGEGDSGGETEFNLDKFLEEKGSDLDVVATLLLETERRTGKFK